MLIPLAIAALLTATPAPRRYALVVGENRGLSDDLELQFALDDARRMRDTLLEVGSVRTVDVRALLGARGEDLQRTLAQLEAQLRQEARPQDQLLIYISSHADEGDLRLNGTRFPLRDLQEFLERVPVGVAILVVDSCRSGALTGLKGLRPISGAEVSIEVPELSGRIVMTSSGADELSQESHRLAGSYFTHHLLSGLRGAADTSGDGRVTLQEAYTYAYARTVENTFGSRGGTQHPSYRVDLKGRGDLVLSEPARGRARLLLTSDASREWLILGPDGSALIAQLVKAPGPSLFAVAPGTYRVRARLGDGYREATVQVSEAGVTEVTDSHLGPLMEEGGRTKGAERSVRVGLGPSLGLSAVSGMGALIGGELRVEYAPATGLGPFHWIGFSLAAARAQTTGGVYFRQVELLMAVGPGFSWRWAWLRAVLGPELGLNFTRQDLLPGGERRWGLQPQLTARAALDARLGRQWTLRLGGFGGAALLRSELGTSVRPVTSGALMVLYEL